MRPSLFTLRSETALAGLTMLTPDLESMQPKGAEPAYQVSIYDFLCNPEGLGGLYLKLRALQIMSLHLSVLNWAHSGSIDANPDYLQALEAPWTSCLARVEQAPGHRPRGRPRAEAGVGAVLGSRALAAAIDRLFCEPVNLPYGMVTTRSDLKTVLMTAASTPAGYEMLREMSFPSFMNENGILHTVLQKGLVPSAENDLDGVTTVAPGTATCLLLPVLICVGMPREPLGRSAANVDWPAPIPLLGTETREGMEHGTGYDFHKLVRGLHVDSPEIVICNAGARSGSGAKRNTLQMATKAPIWAYAIAKIDLPSNPFGAEASAYMPVDLRQEHLKSVLKETAPWFTPRTSLARRVDTVSDVAVNPVSAAAERYRMLSALSAWCRPMKADSPFPGESGAYLIDESPAWFSNSFMGADRELIAAICYAQTHHGLRPPAGWFSPFCSTQRVMYTGAHTADGESLEYKRMVTMPSSLEIPGNDETGGGEAVQIYPGYGVNDLVPRYAATLESPIRGDTGYGELGALGAGLRFLQEAILSRYIAGDLSRPPVVGCMSLRGSTILGGLVSGISATEKRSYWHAQSTIVRGPGSWAWLPSTEVLDIMSLDAVLGSMIEPMVADLVESIDSYGDHPWAVALRRAYANAVGILEVRNVDAEGKNYALRDIDWEAVPRDLSGLASALRQDATVKMSNRHRAVNRLMNRRAPTEKELSATRSYFEKNKGEKVIWRQ